MVIFLVILFKYKNAVKNRHVHVLEEYSRSNNHATLQRRKQLKCNIRTYVGKYTTAYSFIKASFIMSGDMYWFISKIIIAKKNNHIGFFESPICCSNKTYGKWFIVYCKILFVKKNPKQINPKQNIVFLSDSVLYNFQYSKIIIIFSFATETDGDRRPPPFCEQSGNSYLYRARFVIFPQFPVAITRK